MSTLRDILDQLYLTATDERDKGDKFERLMLQFFKTDRFWSEQFADVWMWMEWPERRGRRDNGIDLVATDRQTGEAVAIQCKFFDPGATLYKQHVDSFLSESGKRPFAQRLVVTTTDHWGPNAEAAIEDQQVPVRRLRFMDLAESSIDWSQFDLSTPEVMELKDHKELRDHQTLAVNEVRDGFTAHDRGKLIMACGTGKTFTSLRIAEDLVKPGGMVLFLVPSLSLLSQALLEWSIESEAELRPLAVCSDTKVGRRTRAQLTEDISLTDLALPATTNAAQVYAELADTAAGAGKITVIFSTYQSIAVVADAQAMGLADFDLVICDEAHRTTGVTLVDTDESAFVRVHDDAFIRATRRLYMTATPRIYDDASKAKAGQAQAVLASMDDERTYGPEFHRLGFGEAVTANLLTDYKVLVLAVDEKSVSRTFQEQMAENSELKLSDVAKIVGCWNGLAKRGHVESGFEADPVPMTRAVAFARSIKDSKKFADLFKGLVDDYITTAGIGEDDDTSDGPPLICDVEHVDGTYNVLARNERLDWLKAGIGAGECRVLTNARCLSEGVDVPALDAVMFLNPRKSVVDVVQSVGRVMRRAPGKHYGYIILPIGIPSDMKPEDALKDNERYAVVWEVLQALRAHDERFDAMVNKIELNHTADDRIQVIGVGGFGEGDRDGSSKVTPVQGELVFTQLGEWREAIYAKIVTKVGSRRYWEDWAKDVALIAETHTTRIKALLADPALNVAAQFEAFLGGLRGNLNDSISREDAIDMLSQHLITKPVFDALFEGYSFAENNPVSRVMQTMLDTLDGQNLTAETQPLDKFYESVRLRAAGIDNAEGKQKIVNELYERFFKTAFPRAAESLGIVYTPVQIVDFIIQSVEHLLGEEFGASISDAGVHVLDPFTGTGTFIVRLLRSGLIRPDDLLRKYTNELHANEILLLAYYIAAINIEATYHGIGTRTDPTAAYVPFDGIVLTDTFQMTEDDDTIDEVMFPANNARAAAQKDLDIRVIIANPPYSVGQSSQNDANQNFAYPTLDRAIADTYAKRSTAMLKNSLYDSYIRAVRWASDRIKDQGIIGFVTNGGFIDGNTADGLRQTLADEFTSIYIYNLRGNARTAGELRRREKDNVFGQGARTTVAITLLVKHPDRTGGTVLRYRDIGDYLSRDEKLDIVAHGSLDTIDWQTIEPNSAGDWINQRTAGFDAYPPIASKEPGERAPFRVKSGGLKTNRDAWVYNSSRSALRGNVARMVDFYNSQVEDFRVLCEREGIHDPKMHVNEFIDLDPARFSWDRADKPRLARGVRYTTHDRNHRVAAYRPFNKQHVYFDRILNNTVYQLPSIFPTPEHPNHGFMILAPRTGTAFGVLAVDSLPDLSFYTYTGQFMPRFTYAETSAADDLFAGSPTDRYTRVDNVTDESLSDYRTAYGLDVTKDDVFDYVYGVLHSPDYRTMFAADLQKMLPRIPKVTAVEDFRAFVLAGQQLATLHLGYESVNKYPLKITGEPGPNVVGDELYEWFQVEKMRFGVKGTVKDRAAVVYNSRIIIAGIPDEAHEYMLGFRTALEWVLERYQVVTDKASGIVNNPNDWSREVGDPRYILDLVARVVTVSVETVRIVRSLPAVDFGVLAS